MLRHLILMPHSSNFHFPYIKYRIPIMKFSLLYILLITPFFISCGNDKDVEDAFVKEVEKATQILVKSKNVDDILSAQNILNDAYNIEGVRELNNTGATADALETFEKELDKAQQRVMDGLAKKLADDNVVVEDSIE